ncbi:hypothetical protein J532_3153 [Acinetobacter baumannii 940793]|nr:hypothetical protein J727_0911 [Acinetobacter baumannii 472237-120]EXH18525.1 hypothetical protein J636_1633 [Acinetobacter baumannii 1271213]EXH22310.1 hypothetical protein J643_3727 [Acinetobacter baumannii 1237893]EXI01932.1 hypothetical protein J644_3706 [Acinetobacter baumannii 480175]EXR39560.1 hypothetical protein J668_1061 [Acinetobacter baumannii 1276470-86]EYT38035.1 hypothetical protein J497_02077 [Acinetobacter baumannii 1121032]EZI44595.1 hypothetical protein K037_1324 [Acinet
MKLKMVKICKWFKSMKATSTKMHCFGAESVCSSDDIVPEQ